MAKREPTADGDRRREPRVPVALDVDWSLKDNYLFAQITDISATGIFVRTTSPEPPGTRLVLRFKPDATSEPLEVEGEVMWVNPHAGELPDSGRSSGERAGGGAAELPGMGIRFMAIDFELRDRLRELIRRFMFLDVDC